MLASFESQNIHAILVSESWLKPCLPSTSYSLPGFHLIRNDRTNRGGGGVAIYLRSYLPFKIVSSSSQPPPVDSAEHLLVEVSLSQNKILLGVFYSPSLSINYFTSFESLLESLVPTYSHTILMGDFNTCLLKGDNRSIKLEAIIEACNMQILPLSATHNFPNSTPSLLDLIMVSSSNLVFKHGQCPADAFSYHDLIFLSYKLRPPKIKPKLVLRRNFGGMDIEQLCEDAYNIDWSVIERAPCIDDKVELFCSLLTQLYDVHAPMHYVRLKHLPAPWLSDDLKKLILQKNAALSKLKRNKTEENVRKYAKIRNRCNTLCRDAQRRHIHTSVENGDSSRVWKFLKTVGVGRTSLNTSPPSVDFELLNQHFSNPSNSFDSEHKLQTLRSLSVIPTPNYPPFVFSQFTECDVKKTILSISSNAAGSDNISRNMIVPLLDVITPIITYLLNACVSSSKFPQAWKSAHIIPLPKKSNPVNLSDFRPISILPFLSKVLEKLICQQLTLFLNKHNLLNSLQSGFRPGHSTATALIKVTDDIRWGMDNKQLTVMTLLDFTDCVRGHAEVLRQAGYLRLSTGSTTSRRLHAVYRLLVFSITLLYLLQECFYAYQERGDMVKLSRVMFLLLCHVTSIAKQYVFHVDADRIDELIAGLNEPLFNSSSGASKPLLLKTALHADRLRRGYAGTAVLTCTLWAVFPVQMHARGLAVEFPLWTGIDTSHSIGFAVVLLYTYYVTTLVGIANTTMDAFIAAVLYQCKTQLRILSINFQNLPDRALAISKESGENRDIVLRKLFVDCWIHYQKTTETAWQLQDIFGTAVLIQFGIGGWILCMAAYKLVSLSVLSIEFASMALFISCILTELFLYCYYGTELTDESTRIVNSVYSMEWLDRPLKFKRLLVLLMLRVDRPIRPAAGLIIPLSLDTFIKILKSSYTFYAVLRQTK
ncbi:unnamed protein product [Parnassius mnemosyne]|uniref:Odorant receptor n=1 Tax=Parnassius mnemosyne TaxID=213953 RepID=A0AAV1M9M6_9NEOP